ncbi:uncharacterized protein LOC142605828 [Castanea sativa]|uniref:uncharacterized protein LOC142605828 n=1 Tax=Castanea sativa TaxID=21020 RepID=UPI003F64B54D
MAELVHSAQSFMNAEDAIITKKRKKAERMEADLLRHTEQASRPKKAWAGEKKDRDNKKASSSARTDEQAITFTDEDAERVHHPHDDVIVITLLIVDYTTRRVLVDNESSADILYYPTFQQMKFGRDQLRPIHSPLVGFGGMKVQPVGTITLLVVVGAYPQQINKEVNFLVVDCLSSYNIIIGRLTLNSWKAITSTYHLSVKFPTEYGVGQVQGNQRAARECYLAMLSMDEHVQKMNIDEKRITAEPTKVLEDIPLDESNPKKFTRIGESMEKKTKQDLVQFLKKSLDVFAWSDEDMPGIDPSVITHRLNMYPSSNPVRQKKIIFAPERDNAIKEEVLKLAMTKFIREVYYPKCLANVVMIKKANGYNQIKMDEMD